MITSLEIENFKSWKSTGQIRLAPITAFFGSHSFCTTDEQGTSPLQPLEIDPYGNITNWPKDFFGDEMADLLAMTQAMMKRQREEEENELHRD